MLPVALAVIAASSVFLFLYGINLLYLTLRAASLGPLDEAPPATSPSPRSPSPPEGEGWGGGDPPRVLVQLPIYNERYVAERVIDACCHLDWPRDRLEIQVLDDSDDDTPAIAAAAVARWRSAGVDIAHVRRTSRAGYKAGALAHGLTLSDAAFVAVFDADFVPAPDFLRRMLPSLDDPRVAFVQARWGHLNEEFSLFTYLQSLMTDFHFLVEQVVRPRRGYFTNFAGSAGVWRRAAIDDAGGWSASTLTEDLDLSYRAQLRGWRSAYREDVVVPQELPVSANAYRAQQSRWATGSFQTAARVLWPLLRSRQRPIVKFEGAMHLLGYVAPLAMVAQILCYPILLAEVASHGSALVRAVPSVASTLSLAPLIGMAVAQWRRGRDWWWHWYGLVGWSVLGAGTSMTVVGSIWRALRGGGEFARTPKYRIERLGEEWRTKAYFKPASVGALVELAFGAAGVVLVWDAARLGQPMMALYSGLFATGYLYLSSASLVQSLRQVRYEVVAPRVRAVLPRLQAPALLAAMTGVLLGVAHVLPDPFEDSYQHWLIAANLATTGRLEDPLFQMQDTWLPAYHVLAALVLKVFGIWQIGALKAVSVLLGVATLAITYRLAGSRRRGLVAVALLALNPIFILTSTQAVAEPLLVLCLLAAVWAASAGRLRAAAAFACLACLTGTKAWIWLGCVLLVLAVEFSLPRLRGRVGVGARRVAWIAPALALAVAMQAVFGFASHSVARAAVEVGSATARGSLAIDPLVRGGQFLGYFALASVPIVGLLPFGFARVLRARHRQVATSSPLAEPPSSSGTLGAPAARRFAPRAGSGEIGKNDAHTGRSPRVQQLWASAIEGWTTRSAKERPALLTLVGLPSLLYFGLVAALVFAGVYSGSHRYYYPALPGLALVAAAAVDRVRLPLVLVPVGAAMAVAAAFVPVLNGLAADNRGLVAAGTGASVLPGALLTDSPAAAYWSHKPPAEIYGSRVLPSDRDAALSWIRARGVGGLVLEDIDYYRAHQVLPDLVAGRASPPFVTLGDEASYTVPGGKTVTAYGLSPLRSEPLFGDVTVGLSSPARGKTAPLEKGLVILRGGVDAAGEGMGIGVPIARYADGWHYASSATVADVSSPDGGVAWRKTFDLDMVGGDAAHGYEFARAASVGRVQVTYRVDARSGAVRVEVRSLGLAPGVLQVGVLNEESAAFDDYADASGASRVGADFGNWMTVGGSWARLRSGSLGVEWAQQVAGASEFHAGRELSPPDFDWAGMDYLFDGAFTSVDYAVSVRAAS